MEDAFSKPYDPQATEDRIYKKWLESGFFNPDNTPTFPGQETFSIVLPPPNVTGTLHMGHAAMLALEDIMVRYHRMKGDKTLWLPGTDHAAIATQSKVEKILEKEEGKRKRDLGREEFLKRVEKFARDSHDTIVSQVRKMGSSVDWSREAYTLDEQRNLAVRTAFKRMYDDGLIYRKNRVVNWDPKGQTTISDDEIVYESRKAKLYTFKYSAEFPIAISTTRPETKVGDTAVAVHPSDERYQEYVGKEYEFVFAGVPVRVRIVADESVEKDFGTGALGVTPAHSQIDWEIAQRHSLPEKQVINEYGKMAAGSPELDGKKTTEARAIIVEWLKSNNLLLEEKEIDQNVATAERTGAIIEPLPKLQWFIDVNKEFVIPYSNITGIPSGSATTLKKLMKAVVENGQIEIIPERFDKIYRHWIDNLRDWCISRQIWFGHRVPVWYRDGGEIYCDIEAPEGVDWKQDEDSLDTWFSSGLWTFSTLGWPERTKDLETYHPTSVLETGYDILPFWVARMILMTTYLLGDIPFKTVYLHGLVRDAQGRKMSKSLGNIIDPVDMIAKYGADAARMSLVVGTGPGNDMKLSEDKIKGYKHFANKLWNIARFVTSNAPASSGQRPELDEYWSAKADELEAVANEVTENIEKYQFHLAADKLYHYLWHEFADNMIEQSKLDLKDPAKQEMAAWSLRRILETNLKLLHPFMPFITEEIWGILYGDGKLLMIEKWPTNAA
ncbi:MAG TPA: valine--tRNA ligase [Candidatus Paceibacterota bacterium]|nr:valine--tRNA ligase [Candidatus Paceibacterota bacterium]